MPQIGTLFGWTHARNTHSAKLLVQELLFLHASRRLLLLRRWWNHLCHLRGHLSLLVGVRLLLLLLQWWRNVRVKSRTGSAIEERVVIVMSKRLLLLMEG